MHLTLLGEAGFTRLAELNHAKACELADALAARAGREAAERQLLQRVHRARCPSRPRRWSRRWPTRRILGGVPVSRLIPNDPAVDNLLLVAATETATEAGMGPLDRRPEGGAVMASR